LGFGVHSDQQLTNSVSDFLSDVFQLLSYHLGFKPCKYLHVWKQSV